MNELGLYVRDRLANIAIICIVGVVLILASAAVLSSKGSSSDKPLVRPLLGCIQVDEKRGFFSALVSDPVAFFTMALFVATVWLAVVTLRLLIEARHAGSEQKLASEKSLMHAASSAQAAVAAAKASTDALSLERAYMAFDTVNVFQSGKRIEKDGSLHEQPMIGFEIQYTNMGRTAAKDVRMERDFKIVDFNDQVIPFFECNTLGPGILLGPFMKIKPKHFKISNQDFEDFRLQKTKVIIYSAARYFTLSGVGEEFITEVCLCTYVDGFIPGANGEILLSTRSIVVGPQNQAT